jgi:hypothetical protein
MGPDPPTARLPSAAYEIGQSMHRRMTGGALRAHARSKVIPLVIAAASVPALVAGQSVAAVAATAAPAAPKVARAPMTPALAPHL